MDTLRGSFGSLADNGSYETGEDDGAAQAPPPAIGQDERRMQVRAYNHWASLLAERNLPAIEDLEPDALPDFGPYSVLLDFSSGIDNPGIAYLGDKLGEECGVGDEPLETLADVPTRSLLTRITDHYMQILANQAPIGFEAEFVNQRGANIAYRGILLPFSSDDDTIDFIYGVINWKELADAAAADELLLEIDQALEAHATAPARDADEPLTDWADGPGTEPANDLGDAPIGADPYAAPTFDAAAFATEFPVVLAEDDTDGDLPVPSFGLGDDDEDEGGDDEGGDDEPVTGPSFGSLLKMPIQMPDKAPLDLSGEAPLDLSDEDLADWDDAPLGLETEPFATQAAEPPFNAAATAAGDAFAAEWPADAEAPYELPAEFAVDETHPIEAEPATEIDLDAVAPDDMGLGDWLAAARELAALARSNEDRTRSALYDAIGRAYDFSLAAADAPHEFDELLVDSGLTSQDRAPMTPVVKLVFGADYDKTRLTEYAAALSHGHRLALPQGALGEFLRHADGGLKGVVQAERRLRREDAGQAVEPVDAPREALARKLRALPAQAFDTLSPAGSEFALVMIRRSEDGTVFMLGEVPEDVALVERAGRRLLG